MKDTPLYSDIFEEVTLSNDDGKHHVIFDEKIYSVGSILFFTIEKLKSCNNYQVALDSTKLAFVLTVSEVEEVHKKLSLFLNTLRASKKHKKTYVTFAFTLLNARYTNNISEKLKFVFQKRILQIMIPVSVVVSFLFFFTTPVQVDIFSLAPKEIIVLYFVLLLVVIMHELGHASASKYYGVPPGEIGVGFYLFFPVLYTNVTKIWRLRKNKRILVNIAGILFQLFLNSILILVYLLINQSSYAGICKLLIAINTLFALYSLIPFIRNDGYWIYSDYFDIPNLNRQSSLFPLKILKRCLNNDKERIVRKDFWIMLHSVGNYIFIYFLLFWLSDSTVNLYDELQMYYNGSLVEFVQDYYTILLELLIKAFFLWIILKSFISWIRTMTKEIVNPVYSIIR